MFRFISSKVELRNATTTTNQHCNYGSRNTVCYCNSCSIFTQLIFCHATLTNVGKLVASLFLVADPPTLSRELLHQDVRQTNALLHTHTSKWSRSQWTKWMFPLNRRLARDQKVSLRWRVGVKCSSHLFLCPIMPEIDHRVGV